MAAEWCQRVLQRREELRTAASTVVQRCASLGVVFLELRFCPYAHCREGLTPAEALAAVCDGFAAGASVVAEERCASGAGFSPVQGGVLLHALRDRGPAEAASAVLLARQYAALAPGERPGSRALVLGLALGPGGADAPGAPPLRAFETALRSAVTQRLPLCVTARLGTEEPGLAVAMGATRLRLQPPVDAAAAAHVVSERSASALATLLRSARASATFALSYDVPYGGVCAYAAHPLRALLAAGVAAALCTDALLAGGPPGTPAPTPAGEVAHAVAHAGLTWEAARGAMLNAARGAFIAQSLRAQFLKEYEASLDDAFEAAARAAVSGALPAVGGSSPEALAAAAAARPQAVRQAPRAADPFGSSLYGDLPPSPPTAALQPLSGPVLRGRMSSTPPGGRDASGEPSAPRFAPFMQLPPGAVDVTHPRENEERVLAAARTQAAQPVAAVPKPVPRTTSGRALADMKAGGGGGLRNAQSFASMRARGFSEHSLALTEDSAEGSAAEGGYWTGSDAGAAAAARANSSGADRAAASPRADGMDKISRLQRKAEAERARGGCVAEPSSSMLWLRAALGRMC